MSKIGFIGTGNMGGALARAVGRTSHELLLTDRFADKAAALAEGIGASARACSAAEVIRESDMIFLGVKPQMLEELAGELAADLAAREGHVCFISMAAGVSIAAVESLFAARVADASLIRIMPNTPVAVGEGTVLYSLGATVTEADRALFLDILSHAGILEEIPERLIDAGSAVSGCGPAFVCLFIEALADGGVRCGMQSDKALRLAVSTVKGTAALIEASGQHPGALKDAVCSPGGTTIEGVAVLEDKGFRSAAMEAVTAAYRRTLELKK